MPLLKYHFQAYGLDHPASPFNRNAIFRTAPNGHRKITLCDLLTHTSGIDSLYNGSTRMQAIYSNRALTHPTGANMQALGHPPSRTQSGVCWTYGYNLDVEEYLLEMKNGMSLEVFPQRHNCQPLTWSCELRVTSCEL